MGNNAWVKELLSWVEPVSEASKSFFQRHYEASDMVSTTNEALSKAMLPPWWGDSASVFRTAPKGRTANGRSRFLQKSAVFCGFLRKSAASCGFLRKSATSKSFDLQSEPKISENLQKSAKMCVPGPVSHFCCLSFGAPWVFVEDLWELWSIFEDSHATPSKT